MKKQKTILEWLELLPDGYREICKAEYDPDHISSNECYCLYESIYSLCNWSLSKIGFNFLNQLYTAIKKDNTSDYDLFPPLPDNWQDLYKDKLSEPEIKKPKNPNRKRDKLAVKIYLEWLGKTNPEHYSFDVAIAHADQIIKKLNQ